MMGSYDAGFGTWYLEDSVGRKRAREIWYLNRKYSAKEAQALGLVNEVVPHGELKARTEALCEELKKRGPQALAALKAAFHARHNGVTGMSRMSIDHLVANLLPHGRGEGAGTLVQRERGPQRGEVLPLGASVMGERRIVRTMCPMNCHPTLCGMLVEVEDDRLIGVRGDPDNPDSQGFLCVRGQASREIIGNPK